MRLSYEYVYYMYPTNRTGGNPGTISGRTAGFGFRFHSPYSSSDAVLQLPLSRPREVFVGHDNGGESERHLHLQTRVVGTTNDHRERTSASFEGLSRGESFFILFISFKLLLNRLEKIQLNFPVYYINRLFIHYISSNYNN